MEAVIKRVEFIDIAKGIAIILMIAGHSYSSDNALIHWLNSFHMPLFFIVSGILYGMKKTSLKVKLTDKIRTLLVPYIFWNFLYQMFLAALAVLGGAGLKDSLLYRLTAYFTFGGGAMWFLPVMFCAVIMFILCSRNKVFSIASALVMMAFGLFMPHESTVINIIRRICIGYGFMSAGFWYGKYLTCRIPAVYTLIIFVSSIVLALSNGNVGLSELCFNNRLLYLLNAFLGTFCILQFSQMQLPDVVKKKLAMCGKNSIIYLCTQGFVIQMIRLIDYKLTNNALQHTGLLEGVIITLITISLITVFIPLIERTLYWTFGKKPGQTAKESY